MFPLGMAVCLFGPVQRQDICIESLAESRTVCLRVWGLDLENRPLLCISVTLPSPICKCVSKLKAEALKKNRTISQAPLLYDLGTMCPYFERVGFTFFFLSICASNAYHLWLMGLLPIGVERGCGNSTSCTRILQVSHQNQH